MVRTASAPMSPQAISSVSDAIHSGLSGMPQTPQTPSLLTQDTNDQKLILLSSLFQAVDRDSVSQHTHMTHDISDERACEECDVMTCTRVMHMRLFPRVDLSSLRRCPWLERLFGARGVVVLGGARAVASSGRSGE
jgi:hypothetical protein